MKSTTAVVGKSQQARLAVSLSTCASLNEDAVDIYAEEFSIKRTIGQQWIKIPIWEECGNMVSGGRWWSGCCWHGDKMIE